MSKMSKIDEILFDALESLKRKIGRKIRAGHGKLVDPDLAAFYSAQDHIKAFDKIKRRVDSAHRAIVDLENWAPNDLPKDSEEAGTYAAQQVAAPCAVERGERCERRGQILAELTHGLKEHG